MKYIKLIMVMILVVVSPVYALDSNGVIYDNSTSGSNATNVNDALNDLYTKLNDKQTEINNIKNIGNATSDKILSGYTAYVKGNTITGSIPSKGATTYTPGTVNQTIASGSYLSGAQTIKGDANLVASNIAKGKSIFGVSGTYTSDANAVAGNILSGKTAYVNGSKITGSMANQTGSTGLTLTTADKRPVKIVTKGSGDARIWYLNNSDGQQRLNIGVPANGYYDITVTLAISNTDLANTLGINASKVAKGQTIAGVAGSYTSDANAVAGNILSGKTAYVNGSKITGTMPSRPDSGNVAQDKAWSYNNRIYFGVETGFYSSANYGGMTGVSERYITYESLARDIGLTADKLVSGQTVLGITGTGGGYKAYTFNSVAATVSSSRTFKYGTWVGLADKNETVSFSANLGFTPSEVVACELKLRGNYSSTIETSNDHDFSFNRGSDAKWYKNELETSLSGNYMSNTDSVSLYADTYTNCKVSGSSIIFQLRYVVSGATSNVVSTRADKFYLSGTLVYK